MGLTAMTKGKRWVTAELREAETPLWYVVAQLSLSQILNNP